MMSFLLAVYSQALLFLPLALGISISFHILKATDMTLDGSFVLGAASFALAVTNGFSPYFGMLAAVISGALAGILTASIQRGGKVDPLLAGVLSLFILTSFNLAFMGRPNIGLLNTPTLFSDAFAQNDLLGWLLVTGYVVTITAAVVLLFHSPLGLKLRALGDNPRLLARLGNNVENYRMMGFATTNALSALSGCLTAQIVGNADINMGFGVTLTGIGTIILGQQLLLRFIKGRYFRIGLETCAVLAGISVYFCLLNLLLRLDINPVYLKMIIGILLILFLRIAMGKTKVGAAT